MLKDYGGQLAYSRASVEMFILGIKQRNEAIGNMTDSCKQKTRLRGRNATDKLKLKALMADYKTIRIDEQPADDDGGETSALSQANVEERKLTKLLEGHFPWHSNIDSRTYQLLDREGGNLWWICT